MTNEKENILGAIYGKRFKNISSTFRWQGKIETKVYNEDKILKQSNIPNKQTNQNLLSIFKNIQEVSIISYKKYPSYFSEYIDIGKFAKVMAISSALGDFHSTQKNNARYYLNPYDLKVIPILTDQTHGIIDKNYFSSLPNLYKYLFTTKQFQVKYLETINEINKNFENHIKDTEHICNKYGKICSNLFDADLLKKNIEYVLNNNKELFNHINNLDSTDKLFAGDIAPGNCLIDEWIRKNSEYRYDKDGLIAKSGKVNKLILNQALDNYSGDTFESFSPPSLDIKDFDISFVRGLSLEDGAATLTHLTAGLISEGLIQFMLKNYPNEENTLIRSTILICGGGRKNKYLIEILKKNLHVDNIELIDEYGYDGDFIESQAFGYLAIRSYLGLPISFPNTTGCKEPTTGGVIVKNF